MKLCGRKELGKTSEATQTIALCTSNNYYVSSSKQVVWGDIHRLVFDDLIRKVLFDSVLEVIENNSNTEMCIVEV